MSKNLNSKHLDKQNQTDLVSDFFSLSNVADDFSPNLNIAFAIDKNYLKPCGILIFSILKNNPHIKFDFHIFTNYFDSFGFDELLKQYSNFRIHVYIVNTSYFDNLQTTGHFTTAIYYRLSIAHILKSKVDQYLYLDSDILCFGKMDDLLQIEIKDHVLAAVEDIYVRKDYIQDLGLRSDSQYFNSGVLFINIEKWLDFEVLEKFKQHINLRAYKYPDQDVLNMILENKIVFMNEKFNYFTDHNIQPVFKHFVSTPKPWSICVSQNEDYLQYYYASPWRDCPLNPPRDAKEAKKFAIKLFKSNKMIESFKWFSIYLRRKLNRK
ncbi:glycosyltransferase family 8 protein [Acinetobacter larvae]|uniref:Glycosyl transferase family 8 n=1 Tax=Acinetobacter larvae TaxID=1789224 RepID=A0A1B2LX05_9GAMM|nr:glycosyltransferase [Acinetobacter larvae]AOA57465.1 glycosyl transferase family 8 [Acinetobacter larvae]